MTLARHHDPNKGTKLPPQLELNYLPPTRILFLQVMTLAQHKYASNVVEACLKHGRQAHRDAIVE